MAKKKAKAYTRSNRTIRFRDDRWEQAEEIALREGHNNRTQLLEKAVEEKAKKHKLI
jgi:hypothetical protein